MVALARSTVLMALLAYKPAKEHQDERQTDKRRRRDKGLGAKETAAKRGKKTDEGALFYRHEQELRGVKGEEMEGEKDRSHHARGRGGVWSNLLRGLVSSGFIFHKLFTEPRAHTQNKDSKVTLSCPSILTPSKPDDF